VGQTATWVQREGKLAGRVSGMHRWSQHGQLRLIGEYIFGMVPVKGEAEVLMRSACLWSRSVWGWYHSLCVDEATPVLTKSEAGQSPAPAQPPPLLQNAPLPLPKFGCLVALHRTQAMVFAARVPCLPKPRGMVPQ